MPILLAANAVSSGYSEFEALVIESEHARDLELALKLVQLLCAAVLHGKLTFGAADLSGRLERLRQRLEVIAQNDERPNNALEAAFSLLLLDVNECVFSGDRGGLEAI